MNTTDTKQAEETQTIYTCCCILPHHAGFGMWDRGEVQTGPETSYGMISDLVQEGDLTEMDEALTDPDFIAAGIEDIRGRIHNQPGRIYAKLGHESPEGRGVDYYGVEESEVSADFFTR